MSPATPRPRSQEDDLEAALASLTEADIPPDDADRAWPDPATGRPAELVSLMDAELEELLAEAPPRPSAPVWPLAYRSPEAPGGAPVPAGFEPRDGSGGGAGFADGGPLDTLAAGLALAGFADQTRRTLDDPGRLDDDSLVGVLRAWRRLTSWAQARELAAVAALARRRPADGSPPAARPGQFPARLSEFIAAEVAAALTLTARAAETQVSLALDLAARPATAAALAAGGIDLPRARLFLDLLGPLDPAHADVVEAAVLPLAAGLTTGQLRAALARAILAVDPAAARRRREQAERAARVEHWADPAGTASLAGRNLPPAQVLAASKRLTQIAHGWKKLGALGGMDLLRAHAYLALLNGLDVSIPPASLLPDPAPAASNPHNSDSPHDPDSPHGADGPRDADGRQDGDGRQDAGGRHGGRDPGVCPVPGGQQVPAGLRHPGGGLGELPPLAGQVNLTVPLTTLLGTAGSPGEVPGYGPVDAATARALACALAGHRATRWHITVTGPDGTALATGTHHGQPGAGNAAADRGKPDTPGRPGAPPGQAGGSGWTVQVTAEPIAGISCDHRTAEPGYRPSPSLQRLIRARTVTCTGPGCRRPAARCDLDHTLPHDDGGITCECNLAPLCRFCHRLKHSQHWQLLQPAPGVMIWITPAGRRYVTLPSQHPT